MGTNSKRIISLFLLLLLSGCIPKLELEQRAYAVVIGIDKGEEDGLINVTFQIANPQVGSTEKGTAPNEVPSDIISITATDVLSAQVLANSIITRKISFSHLRTIVIGEEFAKTELFHHMIASAMVDPEMRLENILIITKEKAEDFINNNRPKLETRPHKYYSFMIQRWQDTGTIPLSNLNRYFTRLSGQLYLAIYATTNKEEVVKQNEEDYEAGQIPQKMGDPAQLMGSAVFKEGKMVGSLTGEETRMAMLLRRNSLNEYALKSFKDPIKPDYRITVQLKKKSNSEIKINTKTQHPEVKVRVPIALQIISNPGLVDYTMNLGNQRKLKETIEKELKIKTEELIKKTQMEFEAEPFLWYMQARKQFWTLKDYNDYKWEDKYKNANVEVTFDVTIESFGALIKPEIVEEIKGE